MKIQLYADSLVNDKKYQEAVDEYKLLLEGLEHVQKGKSEAWIHAA